MFSRIVSSVSSALDLNLATLSGCIDILVVPREDGSLQSTPFHVRFGKAKLLRSREKIVTISVNWQPTDLKMKLGPAGEAYFVIEDREYKQQQKQLEQRAAGENDGSSRYYVEDDDHDGDDDDEEEDDEYEGDTDNESDATGRSSIPTVIQPVSNVADDNKATFLDDNGSSKLGLDESAIKHFDDTLKLPETGSNKKALNYHSAISGLESLSTRSSASTLQVELSLCGHLLMNGVGGAEAPSSQTTTNLGWLETQRHDRDVFEANVVPWEHMELDPSLWFHPALVVRFDRSSPLFPARTAYPLLMSWMAYGRPVGHQALHQLLHCSLYAEVPSLKELEDAERSSHKRSKYKHRARRLSDVTDELLIARSRRTNRNHSNYRNKRGVVLSEDDDNLRTSSASPLPESNFRASSLTSALCCMDPKAMTTITPTEEAQMAIAEMDPTTCLAAADRAATGITATGVPATETDMVVVARKGGPLTKLRYKRSLRPTSAQIAKLKLKDGPNAITFSVSSPLQGTKTVTGTIYLWPRNARVVVSDVDGTITRSDVLGQLMPIVGRDWSHPGVAQLFTQIRENGYRILYLTARAIGQADSTRDYLFGLTQNDKNKLPDGPLILSPDRLFPSFKREVIDRKPYVFKIAALRNIRNLFPPYYNPFFAGFGNRDTDHRAYVHIGVPEAKIFIIDSGGTVHHVNTTYAQTYDSMTSMSAEMFPPILEDDVEGNHQYAIDQFDSFIYWKLPEATLQPEYAVSEFDELENNDTLNDDLSSQQVLLPSKSLRNEQQQQQQQSQSQQEQQQPPPPSVSEQSPRLPPER